jgi:DNA-binding MarR family transcriptional regulator
MFLLRDLPDARTFARFRRDFPDLDAPRTAAFLRLLRIGSDLLAELDAFLADYGLGHGRWITLILLRREESGALTPSELAAKQGVTRATMTRLIAGLAADALVTRTEDPDNARQAIVSLTPAGSALLDRIMPAYYRFVRKRMSGLSRKDAELLTTMIARIEDAPDQ